MTIILESKNTVAALHWITQLLEKKSIEYQITGGLAAKVYGVSRPLADIDIDVPNNAIDLILPEITDHIEQKPHRYKDENWDILLLTLTYAGCPIDLGGADDALIFNEKEHTWVKCDVDFKTARMYEFNGKSLPIVAKESLIRYKSILRRKVDLFDLKTLTASNNSSS